MSPLDNVSLLVISLSLQSLNRRLLADLVSRVRYKRCELENCFPCIDTFACEIVAGDKVDTSARLRKLHKRLQSADELGKRLQLQLLGELP